jgi:hypothetical protein
VNLMVALLRNSAAANLYRCGLRYLIDAGATA